MTLTELFTNIANAIRGKDGTTATIAPTDFASRISAIETGVQLPTLSNPGAAGDLRSGKQLIGQDGSTIDGSLAGVAQGTPGISVSSSGLITASVAQSGGIVAAGTKSATKQLTTQAAKTVTPGTSSQTAVNSGVYTTGTVTVSGDSNLVAGNIKSGVSIFGVNGTLEDGWKICFFSTDSRYPSDSIIGTITNNLVDTGYVKIQLNQAIADYKFLSMCASYDDLSTTYMTAELPKSIESSNDNNFAGFSYNDDESMWCYAGPADVTYSIIGNHIGFSQTGRDYPTFADHLYGYIAVKVSG